MTRVAHPVGNETSWTFDILDLVTQKTNELSQSPYFAYDMADNLTKRTGKGWRLGSSISIGPHTIGRSELHRMQWREFERNPEQAGGRVGRGHPDPFSTLRPRGRRTPLCAAEH